MPDLLLELRSEEIPARMQRKAAGDLRKMVTDGLVEAGLTYEAAREYWTPRRLVPEEGRFLHCPHRAAGQGGRRHHRGVVAGGDPHVSVAEIDALGRGV